LRALRTLLQGPAEHGLVTLALEAGRVCEVRRVRRQLCGRAVRCCAALPEAGRLLVLDDHATIGSVRERDDCNTSFLFHGCIGADMASLASLVSHV
jgi:hypothetical protein